MSDSNPDFDDVDSDFESDEETCDYGDEFCAIMLAQIELEKAQKHRVVYFLNRVFSRGFRKYIDDIYGTLALSATEHCSFTCKLRGQWMPVKKRSETPAKIPSHDLDKWKSPADDLGQAITDDEDDE